ncbi:hypothetical protein HPP92_007793 [Vanilla planifolia]|uniref:DRBM domain-containing protein n=1 Tax=Vanilla planifolia TaxID=51239 RepID=A0A835RN31_VANPL|nr:hypothetical protein HPP92_007793 [Vanilla planifolia]
MYKNQLQELAQRSCFNLPSYACVREGPDHAPRFQASVNFNGEIFEGPSNCTTLRQAEHSAAEVALANLSSRAPSRSLAARVLDETGVYKNLLQETAHRAGLKLPVYTTVRSGPGHQPVFTSNVELANMSFAGEPAKAKKQAEKNAAMAAWFALKKMPALELSPRPRDVAEGRDGGEEHDHVVRILSNFKPVEENKQMRQRQRKGLLGYNEGASSSSSPYRSPRFQHQWRSPDPSIDFPLLHTAQQKHKPSSVLPPLLSSGTKPRSPLLLPPNSRLSPLLGSSSSQAGSDIKHLIGWTDGRWMHDASKPFAAGPRSPPCPNLQFTPSPARNSRTILVPRTMSSGGLHNHGIAPAVQIRSVIPVRAAPPMRPPPSQPVADDRPALSRDRPKDNLSAASSQLSNLKL